MNRYQILIVDDDMGIRRVASLSLTRTGRFDVVCAGSTTDALHELGKRQFDAVLVDVAIGSEDGLSLVRHLTGNGTAPSCQVFLFTAGLTTREKSRLVESEAHGVIEKPFDPVALPTVLEARLAPSGQVGDPIVPAAIASSELRQLWDRHRSSVMEDLCAIEDVLTAAEGWAEPSGGSSALGSARSAAHRLAGAFGVYGFEEASRWARSTQVLFGGPTVEHERIAALERLREIKMRVSG